MSYVIVSGNEKGGAGKTTAAIHLITSLLKLGFRVGSIDLDHRQQSLTTYVNNRRKFAEVEKTPLYLPNHHCFEQDNANNDVHSNTQSAEKLYAILEQLKADNNDFIVIDTPGSNTNLNVIAHSCANTILTPINDSFIDLELLGQVNLHDQTKTKPGIYSAMVWEQKLQKAAKEKKHIDWVIMRNRISFTDTLNKRNINSIIEDLSKRFGFRCISGFGDRVIFKELFLYGLTLTDAGKTNKVRFSVSMIAARQELREFIRNLNLPNVVDIEKL